MHDGTRLEGVSRHLKMLQRRGIKYFSSVAKIQFPESTFAVHNCPVPALETEISRKDALELYKQMVEIRRLEMACDQVIYISDNLGL